MTGLVRPTSRSSGIPRPSSINTGIKLSLNAKLQGLTVAVDARERYT
ncbi:MAG: hypothetical protein GX493_01110 [Firmicutes bacterium]|nr:hypothetical protein [Bacillota bacterium]